MMRYIWITCLAFSLFLSCTDKPSADVSSATNTVKSATAKPKVNKEIKTAPVGLNKPKAASGSIQIGISDSSAEKGEEACVSLTAKRFNEILGLQFSVLFDPSQLKFKKSTSYGLPGLNNGSFGATKVDKGSLNFLWFDMKVKGVSLPDEAVLYDLCFDVLAAKGTSCEVSIGDKPLKMEVVGPNKSRMILEATSGKISVK